MLILMTNVLILRIPLGSVIVPHSGLRTMMLSLFSRSFYPAVVGSLDQLLESRDGIGLERAMSYLKAITTAGFLVSLEVINATLNLTKPVAKKLQGIKKLF